MNSPATDSFEKSASKKKIRLAMAHRRLTTSEGIKAFHAEINEASIKVVAMRSSKHFDQETVSEEAG